GGFERMARRADLGGVAQKICNTRPIQIDGRAGDSKRRGGNEKFCSGADAVWTDVSCGRFGAHCSADGSERIESGGCGRAGSGGGVGRGFFEWEKWITWTGFRGLLWGVVGRRTGFFGGGF